MPLSLPSRKRPRIKRRGRIAASLHRVGFDRNQHGTVFGGYPSWGWFDGKHMENHPTIWRCLLFWPLHGCLEGLKACSFVPLFNVSHGAFHDVIGLERPLGRNLLSTWLVVLDLAWTLSFCDTYVPVATGRSENKFARRTPSRWPGRSWWPSQRLRTALLGEKKNKSSGGVGWKGGSCAEQNRFGCWGGLGGVCGCVCVAKVMSEIAFI